MAFATELHDSKKPTNENECLVQNMFSAATRSAGIRENGSGATDSVVSRQHHCNDYERLRGIEGTLRQAAHGM